MARGTGHGTRDSAGEEADGGGSEQHDCAQGAADQPQVMRHMALQPHTHMLRPRHRRQGDASLRVQTHPCLSCAFRHETPRLASCPRHASCPRACVPRAPVHCRPMQQRACECLATKRECLITRPRQPYMCATHTHAPSILPTYAPSIHPRMAAPLTPRSIPLPPCLALARPGLLFCGFVFVRLSSRTSTNTPTRCPRRLPNPCFPTPPPNPLLPHTHAKAAATSNVAATSFSR